MLALEGYSAFAAAPGLSLALVYRLFNFLYPAMAALSGIGIFKLYQV
ncbi:MAG: hypothetical protein QW413_06680 [Nitrososphaerota archaeon]